MKITSDNLARLNSMLNAVTEANIEAIEISPSFSSLRIQFAVPQKAGSESGSPSSMSIDGILAFEYVSDGFTSDVSWSSPRLLFGAEIRTPGSILIDRLGKVMSAPEFKQSFEIRLYLYPVDKGDDAWQGLRLLASEIDLQKF